jgi:hypothetical protein
VARLEIPVVIDPRLIDAVVAFTTEVAETAATLANLGMTDEASSLLAALDRLDAAGRD